MNNVAKTFFWCRNMKQMKDEAERAAICRMWNGKGDSIELSGGSRSFKSTSISMCLYIQPQPIFSEMCCMTVSDGFLDRFLFIASRPILHNTATISENYNKSKVSNDEFWYPVWEDVYRPSWRYYLHIDRWRRRRVKQQCWCIRRVSERKIFFGYFIVTESFEIYQMNLNYLNKFIESEC